MSQPQIKSDSVEDYYPLSPMQEGMLLHTVYGGELDLYVFQLSCSLLGALDVGLFTQAWQVVLNRHAVLRTFFLWEGLARPVQVVKKSVELPINVLDWREVDAREQQEKLERFLAADRATGFDPKIAPLMRLTLIRSGEEIYRMIWTHHHLLLDGWSLVRVLNDVQTSYSDLRRGSPQSKESPPRYRNYIRWLYTQDLSSATSFWSDLLKGFSIPTPLAMGHPAKSTADERQEYRRQSVALSIEGTDELRSMARRLRLTMNILVQGAWALLLARYAGIDDVVFGAVVSGRPSELSGVTEMVGLFINTLPVRVRIASGIPIDQWLEDLRRIEAGVLRYEHTPLVEAQKCSEVTNGSALFESILAFDNYPVNSALRNEGWDLRIDDVRSFQRSNYPLAIVAMPGTTLTLMASYDSRRFDDSAIVEMLRRLERLLCTLPSSLGSTLDDLQVFSAEERALFSKSSEVREIEETFSF